MGLGLVRWVPDGILVDVLSVYLDFTLYSIVSFYSRSRHECWRTGSCNNASLHFRRKHLLQLAYGDSPSQLEYRNTYASDFGKCAVGIR